MERVSERIALAQKALATFEELAKLSAPSVIERDAAIQRFEYSFEALWKATQRYLKEREGIEAPSPKAVIRAALRSALLNETEARKALQMADDRNLTLHTYHEAVTKLNLLPRTRLCNIDAGMDGAATRAVAIGFVGGCA